MKDTVEVGVDRNFRPGRFYFCPPLLPSSRLAPTGAPFSLSLSLSEPDLFCFSYSLGPPSTPAPPPLSARRVLVSLATDDIIESRAESEASRVEEGWRAGMEGEGVMGREGGRQFMCVSDFDKSLISTSSFSPLPAVSPAHAHTGSLKDPHSTLGDA